MNYKLKLESIFHNSQCAREGKRRKILTSHNEKKIESEIFQDIIPSLIKINALRYPLFSFQVKLLSSIVYTIQKTN